LTEDTREKKLAEAVFKKKERATQGAKAMAEYKATVEAERAKTGRLRALRLAKEASGRRNEQRYRGRGVHCCQPGCDRRGGADRPKLLPATVSTPRACGRGRASRLMTEPFRHGALLKPSGS
jgi:hypothetical protein